MIIFMKFIFVLHRGAEFTVARETTFDTVAQKNYGVLSVEFVSWYRSGAPNIFGGFLGSWNTCAPLVL